MPSRRALAASSRSFPYCCPRRMIPRQARYPCSGCGRRSMIWATSCPVAGPACSAQRISRDGVHSACARWGARHVLAMGGRLPVVAPPVRRQSLAAIEDLDRVRGVADLDLLADQLERHAIDVALDLDVVVDVKCCAQHLTSYVAFLVMWCSRASRRRTLVFWGRYTT